MAQTAGFVPGIYTFRNFTFSFTQDGKLRFVLPPAPSVCKPAPPHPRGTGTWKLRPDEKSLDLTVSKEYKTSDAMVKGGGVDVRLVLVSTAFLFHTGLVMHVSFIAMQWKAIPIEHQQFSFRVPIAELVPVHGQFPENHFMWVGYI